MAASSPMPVTSGSLVFMLIAISILAIAWGLAHIKRLSKDSAQIISVITVTGAIATWLLWLCAWMHQWHPLMMPQWKGAE